MLLEHETECRRTQAELGLFGLQPLLGEFPSRLCRFDAGPVHLHLSKCIPHFQGDGLSRNVQLAFREPVLIQRAVVIGLLGLVAEGNHE